MFRRVLAMPVVALNLCAHASGDQGIDFFETKVRPLLEAHCLECHSTGKKIKGGLRLDSREGWVTGGDSGPAIVPGQPDKSLLITAVRYLDRDLRMPEKRRLADAEIATLERWVAMGAPDSRTSADVAMRQTGLSIEAGKKFWCYRPVRKEFVPAVRDVAWPRGEVDRFILTAMEARGIRPATDAAPEVLVRRLCYSLIGLPPTPEQIDTFTEVARCDPVRAVNALIDELLASRHFGETWGRHWLDVARFAESSGGGRTLLFKDAWRYRDYVIEAWNANMPFDQFIREQVAGDLLPASTPAERRRQLTATAFLALGPTNYEEQDKQQLRFDIIDEQLDTIGRAFLGQTIGCARCHDHKFDPIPQRDYYALAGIFASTRTLFNYSDNVARWIVAPLPGVGAAEEILRAHESKVAALEKELAAAKAMLAQFSKALAAEPGKAGMPVAPASLPGIVIDDSQARIVGEWKHSTYLRSYIGKGYLHDMNSGKGEKTITFTPMLPKAGRYDVRLAYATGGGRATNVRVTVFHADGEETIIVDQAQAPPIEGRFISLGKFRFEKDGAGYVLITNEESNGFVTVDALQFVPENETALTENPRGADAPARVTATSTVERLEAALKALRKNGPARDTAMAVHDDEQIADTQIRVRGIEKQRGEKVPRGFLQVALEDEPHLPRDQSGRRELADWIASPSNPLTARVFVNRIWAWLFGGGLVGTVDNFGTTGQAPSHPELLDYLASRFVADGWDVKKLIRLLAVSRTWGQAVLAPTPADPENALFAHANRRRLDAEQLRDALLAVSGRLRTDYLGLNIVGASDIDANNPSAQDIEYGYVFADARRSVYTPAFRNKRLELFEVFDFGDINTSMGARNVSTVAPQALYLLNQPFILDQARAAAERTLASPGDDADRITTAFRRAFGRRPTAAEQDKCRSFLGPNPTLERWAALHQTLFGCIDFRYLD